MLRRSRGFVLLTVVLALALLAIIAALLLERGGTAGAVDSGYLQSAAFDYAAAAGLAHARAAASGGGVCAVPQPLPSTPFAGYTYSSTVALAGASPATTYNFSAAADTWVRGGNASDNFGTSNDLKNRRKTGDHQQSILRFDLSSLPADLDIASAVLHFFVKTKDDSGSAVEVFQNTTAWAEATATWQNQGDLYDAALLHGSFLPTANGAKTVDVTRLVRKWVSGAAPNYGLRFISTSNDKESIYASKEEGDVNRRPRLEVTTRPRSRIAVTAVAADASGNQRTESGSAEGLTTGGLILDYFATGFGTSHGTRPWSGAWQEINESDGPSAGATRVVADARCAYGSCLRLDAGLLLSTSGAWRAVALAGVQSAVLRLHTRRDGGNWTLQVSSNGGSSWSTLKASGNGNDSAQVRDTFDISAYATANTRIRFTNSQLLGLGDKLAYIDDVEIEAACPP